MSHIDKLNGKFAFEGYKKYTILTAHEESPAPSFCAVTLSASDVAFHELTKTTTQLAHNPSLLSVAKKRLFRAKNCANLTRPGKGKVEIEVLSKFVFS